ncbi:MAG: hypothetical protein DID92_2727744127 [Candidatus Nitrotoga sp. SPKER]|nr:MAG: hypothetical protein DID92_2727744127 [Candidatus Nitrotoga sp. SPKER]
MNKSLISLAITTCYTIAIAAILTGCEGGGQLAVHGKKADNQQTPASSVLPIVPKDTHHAVGADGANN